MSASPWACESVLLHISDGTALDVFITARPLPAPDTNAKPGTVATSKGFPPVCTIWLVTWPSCEPLAARVVHPGTASGFVCDDPTVLAFPVEKGLTTTSTAATTITTTPRASRAHRPRWPRPGPLGGGGVTRRKAGGGPAGGAG